MKESNTVRFWLDSYPKDNTKSRYRTALSKFCDFLEVTPDQTLRWSRVTIEDNLLRWKAHMTKELSGNTTKLYLTGVTRWFKFNRKRIEPFDLLKNLSRKQTFTDYPVSRDDLRKVLDGARLKHKVAISLIAFAGLRPVDVVTLQYRDIVESYKRGDEVLTIQKVHEKTEREYVSFLGFQGTRYLRDYLELRESKGEKLTQDSYIMPYRGGQMQSQGLRLTISTIIEATVGTHPTGSDRKKFRPYSLRKYFRHVASGLGESTAEYLMGHIKGLESMSAVYNGLRDGHPESIERLKQQYISILPELETELPETTIRAEIQEQKEEAIQKQISLEEQVANLEKKHDALVERVKAESKDANKLLDELEKWLDGRIRVIPPEMFGTQKEILEYADRLKKVILALPEGRALVKKNQPFPLEVDPDLFPEVKPPKSEKKTRKQVKKKKKK